jgi:hypothetical protein
MPARSACAMTLRMRIWITTTGTQHAIATTYRPMDHATHGVEYGNFSMCTRAKPLTGCRIAVVVVSSQSASTTLRVTVAMPPTCRRKVAANRWKAEPMPAPNRIVDDRTWTHFRKT